MFTKADRRMLGYKVNLALTELGKMDAVAESSVRVAGDEGETFSELYDRIGGIVADALERELAAERV